MLIRGCLLLLFCIPMQALAQNSVFDIYKQKLEFLTKNDAVIAQNIANADTPKYKPKKLEEKKQNGHDIKLYTTNPMHIRTESKDSEYILAEAEISEIKPNENAVTIEDELLKKSQNSMQLQQVTNLYNKSKNMMKYAITGQIK